MENRRVFIQETCASRGALVFGEGCGGGFLVGNRGNRGIDGGEQVSQIAVQTHRSGVVRGGRMEGRDWRLDLMEHGCDERAEFPAGREDQFGKAGNEWVAVIVGPRRRLGEPAR